MHPITVPMKEVLACVVGAPSALDNRLDPEGLLAHLPVEQRRQQYAFQLIHQLPVLNDVIPVHAANRHFTPMFQQKLRQRGSEFEHWADMMEKTHGTDFTVQPLKREDFVSPMRNVTPEEVMALPVSILYPSANLASQIVLSVAKAAKPSPIPITPQSFSMPDMYVRLPDGAMKQAQGIPAPVLHISIGRHFDALATHMHNLRGDFMLLEGEARSLEQQLGNPGAAPKSMLLNLEKTEKLMRRDFPGVGDKKHLSLEPQGEFRTFLNNAYVYETSGGVGNSPGWRN